MQEFCEIRINGGDTQEVPRGQRLSDLAKKVYGEDYEQAVLAVYNEKLTELTHEVKRDGSIDFLTTDNKDGQRAYRRSLIFLMHKALHELFPEEKPTVFVQYSIGDGYYCTFGGGRRTTKKLLSDLKKKMKEIVALDLPITKNTYPTSEAIELFAKGGMPDK